MLELQLFIDCNVCLIIFSSQITWLGSDNTPIHHNIETIVETLPDGKRENTRSLLRMKMKRRHHNTSIVCQAQNSAETSPSNTAVLLWVEYSPSVTIEQTPRVVREGNTVVFTCRGEGNPGKLTYQWFVGGKEQRLGEEESRLVMAGVGRGDNRERVQCRVTNTVGSTEETITLNISCK